ncbi:GNAT family N-acetyltransferase [Flexivirga sp. ID2601S]|uniref:GNAT family N-acetyltransferase n=1 Tax=Flexivirga aerilata TaxID=1656889 RepID=A0A849AJ21_9MICO|nr:GNAT family N-acetyltransferase [Flexivirga aerilata]NNG39331.1 GNAT family N-acetyltransferase [Flexivirga aerilata]
MRSDFRIEPFAEADAPELAAMHMQVWRDTYAGMLSQDYLDSMELGPRIAHWRKRIGVANAREHEGSSDVDGVRQLSRLARHLPSGRIAGFCQVGAARDEGAPVAQELGALNVLREFHGCGVAGQLVDATLGGLPAYLWVVEQNLRAQAFYAKLGFAPDGGRQRDDELGCDELRMVRGAQR